MSGLVNTEACHLRFKGLPRDPELGGSTGGTGNSSSTFCQGGFDQFPLLVSFWTPETTERDTDLRRFPVWGLIEPRFINEESFAIAK